jgi:hypothetical protein
MKSNNDVPSLVLMQSSNSTLLYRNFGERMSKDKWTNGVVISYGPGTGMDLRFCWRLDDTLATHNPGDTYQVDFSIKGIAVYDGCYVNPPFKPTLSSAPGSTLLRYDVSNTYGSPMLANNHINKLYRAVPQSQTPYPIYWNFMRSRANLGTSMVLKAKVYIYGSENYVSQSYHEWDLFFHMVKGSGSGYPWTLVEKTFTLVKTSNGNGSQLKATNVSIEHNVVGTGTDSRVYLYVKLNQTVNANSLLVVIVPEACTTTRNLVDAQSLSEWTTSMAS